MERKAISADNLVWGPSLSVPHAKYIYYNSNVYQFKVHSDLQIIFWRVIIFS